MAKITQLTALSEVPATGDLVACVDVSDTTDSPNGTTKQVTRQNYLGYTEYVALLTQTSTNAPTATVVRNDTGAIVSFSYVLEGLYRATFNSAVLTASKTVAILVCNDAVYSFAASVISTTQVSISTQESGVGANSVLASTPVIVRIYV